MSRCWLLPLLVSILFSFGCSPKEDCVMQSPVLPYELKLEKNLLVNIPIEHFPGYNETYSLNTQQTTLLVTNGSAWFFFIDLETETVSERRQLGISKIRKVSGALYHNDDSIFFMNEHPPMLMIMDAKGKVSSTREMDDAPVSDWYMTMDETLYSFEVWLPQSRMTLYESELTFLLASEFYYFPDKSKIEFFATYDLVNSEWENVLAKAPDEYLEDNVETPDQHLYPFAVRDGDNFLISFPLSHTLQAYHLENEKPIFDSLICAQSKFIDRFIKKVSLGDLVNARGIDYYISAPAYGALNYHSEAGVFSRVVRHEFSVLEPGTPHNLCSVNYSLQVFSDTYQLLDEIYLEAPKHQWNRPIPTKSGFLLLQYCMGNTDDSFMAMDEFKLVPKPLNP